MSQLDSALASLTGHPGVEHLILLGRDGLVIQHIGQRGDEEMVAARVPGIAAACEALGSTAGKGSFGTAVLEFDRGVAIIVSLSNDLLLLAVVRPGVGFASLLRDLRSQRGRLTELL